MEVNTGFWWAFFIIAIVSFVGIIIAGLIWRRRSGTKSSFSMVTFLMGATFVSSFFVIFPYCRESLGPGFSETVETVFHTLRIDLQAFSLDADFMELYEGTAGLSVVLQTGYRCLGSFLYILAPLLLVSFFVTLFQRVFDRMKLYWSGSRNIYIFSDLNTNSLILARSCTDHDNRKGKKKPVIVFTDVYEQSEEESSELNDSAREIGAVCQRNDILDLRVNLEKKRGNVWFFLMGSDETENTGQALSLIDRYGNSSRKHLYIQSDSVETELMLESAMSEDTRMEIRRINTPRSLVYSYLYDTEHNCLFKYACEPQDGEKILSVVLVGLGRQGMEFLRALVWYGQMPGYRIQIHVFEKDPLAEEKFTSLCPELMEMNHNHIEGESQYDIWFHHSQEGAGIDVETEDFDQEILGLSAASIAYVTLGDDAENIRIAVKLRQLFTQSGLHIQSGQPPVIQAVVRDPKRNDMLQKHPFCDYRGEQYDIEFIGDAKERWSYNDIINPALEEDALNRHLKWVDKTRDDYEDEKQRQISLFYQYEYYRKSSMSSAIRSKARKEMKIPGAEKKVEDRTEEEQLGIERIEHAGWNAYMRSEGYRYAENRYDLAKCHNLLIPFDDLPEKEKLKDDD